MTTAIGLLTWFGNACLVGGLYGIGNKWRPAFLLSALGEAAWITSAYARKDYALGFMCVVFGAMAIVNYFKWGMIQPADLLEGEARVKAVADMMTLNAELTKELKAHPLCPPDVSVGKNLLGEDVVVSAEALAAAKHVMNFVEYRGNMQPVFESIALKIQEAIDAEWRRNAMRLPGES